MPGAIIKNLIYHREEAHALDLPELENQVTTLRMALSFIVKTTDTFNKCQILTNLGNLFSHIGRFSEAQEYFNKAIQIDNEFSMAYGNTGFALYYYARVISDPNQQFIFLQYARKHLLKALNNNGVYQEAKQAFRTIIDKIETIFSGEELNDYKNYSYSLGKSVKEKRYRQWCIENTLFINPLNDILKSNVVAHDYLFTPTMVFRFDEKPIFHSLYNQLKQEFVSARYLYYESITTTKQHFSDSEVTLMDTLDYCIYSFGLEKCKTAFKMAYSLFDKIAYFLNEYFKLQIKSNRINFRSIWYLDGNRIKGLRPELLNKNNWALRGLFWLSKDLSADGYSSIEPEAKQIGTLRNYMEHKSFKIVDSFNESWTKETETFEIDRVFFYQKTLKILKLSRAALMYLSFSIYDEETDRKPKNGITIPQSFIKLNDKRKV